MLVQIYNAILYQPLFNLLIFFYNLVPAHDLGLAIILLTIFIKAILWPFFAQSMRAQKVMQNLQPKLDELKAKYKGNQEKLGPAIMELYKTEKVNPLSSCFPMLIQMPFLIAVYQDFSKGIASNSLNLVYSFLANPGYLNTMALGFLDLSRPSHALAILAGLAQFWQSRQLMARNKNVQASTNNKANAINQQMMYIFPVITVVIGWGLPSGLTFYWLLFTLLGVLQQHFVFKKMNRAG